MTTITVLQTDKFRDWMRRLRDERAKARIAARLRRREDGNPGDTRSLGDGLMEMRIDSGPGYRIYFARRGFAIGVLLCGGDKGALQHDIGKARELMKELER